MNILHVTPVFYPAHSDGGPVTAFHQLCLSLAELGCDVRVLTTDSHGWDKVLDVDKQREVEFSKNLRVRYCKRLMRRSVSPSLLGLLPRYVQWADVVHLSSAYNFPTIPTLVACKIYGKPIVWSPHGALQRWSGSRRTKAKAVWEWICRTVASNKLILHTTSDKEAQASCERFPDVEAVVIPYCIHIPDRVAHVDSVGLMRLLYLGRLDPKKGLENLIDACKILNDNYCLAWSLTIAGTGDLAYTESLRDRIFELRLQNQVQMLGEVLKDTKERIFENADILVVPSHTENFGVVVAEALAREVPVIASSETPWRRLEEEGCGLWVNNNPETLAKTIERISRLSLREMGERGRKWAWQEFRCDVVAQEMITLYDHARLAYVASLERGA